MSYQVLARKWRPQSFVDVVGQQHVLTALANGLSLGRLHHAYLFSGTRGVGKTSIARLLAKGLNCETGITATPCGVCDNCREIAQGRFVDLLEIDAASRTKVEDTRDLLDNVQYAPARGRFKVYLIDEVHMLSRHSFNALLKTLEEPPEHVKFLLATTDPQKLPVTILSRCLQFHLKALDVEQIRQQLTHILEQEEIVYQPRALQLLSRAAQGSLRDALSLTDQAIASGNGEITTDTVSIMLGTLDDDQALSLVEAVIRGDGPGVMVLLDDAAARGVEWEALLVEMLSLLHRIAMVQLSPMAMDNALPLLEQRMRELARVIPPSEVQFYYQTLLVGRKELSWAPDSRMGIEMTLLRALAFHPHQPLAEPAHLAHVASIPVINPVATAPEKPASPSPVASNTPLPDTTRQILQARSQLMQQGSNKAKKSEPAAPETAQPVSSVLQRLAASGERSVSQVEPVMTEDKQGKPEAYRWKSQRAEVEEEPVATPKALRTALAHEKSPELLQKLSAETMQRDGWAAEINQLTLPKLVEQLALNAWQEREVNRVCLHLRPRLQHLNTPAAQAALQEALSTLHGETIELTVIEDDNLSQRTPLEWRQTIYEDKLLQARESVTTDSNIQTLCRLFDAELDEESIRPI